MSRDAADFSMISARLRIPGSEKRGERAARKMVRSIAVVGLRSRSVSFGLGVPSLVRGEDLTCSFGS